MATSTTIDVDGFDDIDTKDDATDKLTFQEFAHDSPSKEKEGDTHQFTNFPHSAADSDEEDDDQAELLKEKKGNSSFWTFAYYQQFFDVETHHVGKRILASMIPRPGRNYLVKQIRPNPDLYGPFWICTTLVFTTAIAGNLANYFTLAGKDYKWTYDFHKEHHLRRHVLTMMMALLMLCLPFCPATTWFVFARVTFAASAIFSYWWLIPLILSGLLWWRGNQAKYSFLELICLYGYSLAIYIPISVLWAIQVAWLQWTLVVLGAVLSGSVLLLTFWPAVAEDNKKIAFGIMIFIFVMHFALAAGFVLYFFHVPASTITASTVSNSTAAAPTITPKNLTVKNLESKTDHPTNLLNQNVIPQAKAPKGRIQHIQQDMLDMPVGTEKNGLENKAASKEGRKIVQQDNIDEPVQLQQDRMNPNNDKERPRKMPDWGNRKIQNVDQKRRARNQG